MRELSRWVVALIVVVAMAGTASAGDNDNKGKRLTTTSAVADALNETVLIRGKHLGDSTPEVTLELVPLTVVSATPSEVIALLPPGLVKGS